MSPLVVQTEDVFTSLLELAAVNDAEGFKRCIECDPLCIDEIGLWYGRQNGTKQMVNDHRTPLMVAAMYGSIDVMKLILTLSDADVNRTCGLEKITALHCASSGGAFNAVDAVKVLLAAGADPNQTDAGGRRPRDVIVVPPRLMNMKLALEELLSPDGSIIPRHLRITIANSNLVSPPLSPLPENGSPASLSGFSPKNLKVNVDLPVSSVIEKREYPIDPSLPDIKNSIYSTDEFRMYSFKVRPCSRAYSHDWTECPFVHPGENARRRDPRKFHYSCVPCPDFRKGACRRGDMCEYAHGVFECWLHPAQYRTRLCKDGTGCARRVCFFAHTEQELRPLYVSTGSAVPSPRSGASAMDFSAALSVLPGSPSSANMMSPSPFTPPMSPSANGMPHSSVTWSQQNVPNLHLSGANIQSSRLRSSLNARDIPMDDFDLSDFDAQQQQLLNKLSVLSQSSIAASSLNCSGRMKPLNLSILDDLFSAEDSSPCYADQGLASAVFSPTHKSAMINQFQQQQSMLAPINTTFSPKSVDHHPLLQASFGVASPGRMSPRNMEPISPLSSRLSVLAQREKQQLRSLSSREPGSNSSAIVGSPVGNSWSKWGSPNGKLDWAMSADELGRLRRSNSFELGENGEEPDLSWVQSLVKESPGEIKEVTLESLSGVSSGEIPKMGLQMESVDHAVLGAWLEQMQLDQLVAQQI